MTRARQKTRRYLPSSPDADPVCRIDLRRRALLVLPICIGPGGRRSNAMSEQSQGPGWWQASDGKWYPPEQAPPGDPTADPGGSTAPPLAAGPASAAGGGGNTSKIIAGVIAAVL